MNSVFVDAREWFDRVNGNSYFSARVYVDGAEVARIPFQYGYGSQYEAVAAWTLQDLGLIPLDAHAVLWRLTHESGAALYRSIHRVSKRECVGWGTPWSDAVIVPGRYARPMTATERDALAVTA